MSEAGRASAEETERSSGSDEPAEIAPMRWGGFAVAAIAAAVFVVLNRQELPSVWRLLRAAKWGWVAVGLLAMAIGFVLFGCLHAAARRAVGVAAPVRWMIPVAVRANALNLVVKSGGMAGLAVFLADGRRRRTSRGSVVAGYVLVVAVLDIAFSALLVIALAAIVADRRFTVVDGVASVVFVGYLTVRGTLLAVAWRSRGAVRRVMSWPARAAARIRRRPAAVPSHETADELFDALQMLRRSPGRVLPVLACAVGVDLVGVIELWAVGRAVGTGTGLVVAFIAYLVSALFAIVGVLPAGLGFVEVSASAVLVSFGATATAAAATVVLFRVFELWLPLLAGGVVGIRLRMSRR